VRAIDRQTQRAPDDVSFNYERHRQEGTLPYRLVQ
jgi:hypothetical protein